MSFADLLCNICVFQKSRQRELPGGGVGQSNGFCRDPGNKVFDILKLKVHVLYRTFLCTQHTSCLLAVTVISIKAQCGCVNVP